MTAENTETHCAPPAESEDAYRSLAANLPCIVYRVFLRENGRMRFFNDVIESATGYRMDELTRGEVCSIDRLIVEEDRLRITSSVQRAVERTEPFNVEYRIRSKDGSVRYFSERGRPTLGSDGRPDCIDGTIFDITEQKLAEQKLKESERRYDELAAQNRTIAWEVNAHGLYTFASHVSEAVLGFRPDELEGKRFFYDLHPETGRAAFKEEALAVFARKEPFIGLENPCVTRDGRIVWMLTNGIPILGAGGDLLGYRGSDTDITERKLANQKLQESETLFKGLFHNHTAVKLILDPDTGHIVDANQAAADFYGWPKARLCRMRIQDINTLSLDEITREMRQARLQRRAYFEFRHRRSDGSIRNVAVFSSTMAIGERHYLHSIIHDITDQKLAEEALRTNQKDLQALFNAIAESVYLLDRNGAVIAANETFAKRLGRTVEECIGKSVYSLISGPVAERRKAIAERVVQDGKPDSFEDERNGRWYYHSIFPVMDGQAAVARLAVFTMDITSRKQVADAQAFLLTCGSPATGEDFFVSLARHLSVTLGMECACIDHLESDGKTAETVAFYADGKFENNVRYTLENTPCGEVIGQSECCYTKNVQQVFPHNLILRKLDAESYSGTTLRDSKGRPIGLIAVIGHHPMNDPERVGNVLKLVAPRAAGEMERRLIEEDRVRLQAQLSQSQKMESIGRLAGGVAHDFNNMLGVIIGNAELALADSRNSDEHSVELQEILKAAERSANLTRQLLAYARKQTVTPKVVDLNAAIAGMLTMLRRLIGEDIELVWEPKAGPASVLIDPSQIDQILANLAINARDAITGIGRVTITTESVLIDSDYSASHADALPGPYVMLSVSDNGCGMDESLLKNIFEPFFTTKPVGEGTGLGLATVYGITKQNSGFITVYSEPRHGTTFRVYLRLHTSDARSEQSLLPAPLPTRGQETILLVEDEPSLLKFGKLVLSRLGYQVLEAADPDTALQLARAHPDEIDLLLTDVVMPQMNGWDLSDKIAAIHPGIARLFMSGYADSASTRFGTSAKEVFFVSKPFSSKELAAKVRAALDSRLKAPRRETPPS